MVALDGHLQCVVANGAAQQLLAPGRAPLAGRSGRDFCSQAWVTRTPRQRAAALSSGRGRLQREALIVTATGERLCVDVAVDVVTVAGGQVFFLVQLRDVSGDRRRQNELVFTEVRYRQLAWELPDTSVSVFGPDLRPLVLAGPSEPTPGYDATGVQRLRDVVPVTVLGQLDPALRAAWTGLASAFEYANPDRGRQVRLTVQALTSAAGTPLGFVAVSALAADAPAVGGSAAGRAASDSRDSVRSDPGRQLSRLGSCSYRRGSGWTFSAELLELWGIDPPADPWEVVDDLVVAEDRDAIRAGWGRVASEGGRCTIGYRIRRGPEAQSVYLLSTFEAVVDVEGRLLRAIATHVDVTAGMSAAHAGRGEEAASAAKERALLLSRVSDALATTDAEDSELTQGVVELASAVLGDGAVLRVLGPQGWQVESDAVAHRTERGRQRIIAGLRRPGAASPVGRALQEALLGQAQLVSSVIEHPGQSQLRGYLSQRLQDRVEHFIVAPVRHRGRVLATLIVFRTDPDTPYSTLDVELVQILADRLSTVIIDGRSARAVEHEQAERYAANQRVSALRAEQEDLLEQLTSTETRERSRLAVAVHDDPLQLITTAIFRLDLLSQSQAASAVSDDVHQVADMLVTAADQLRHLLVSLTPPDLRDGLGGAVLRLAEATLLGTDTTVRLRGARHVHLASSVQASVYQILREALINIARHAAASTVTLHLQQRDGHVMLTLTDDGVGSVSMDAGPGHLGLVTMRARAATDGINLTLDSVPGQGTRLQLKIPGTADDDG